MYLSTAAFFTEKWLFAGSKHANFDESLFIFLATAKQKYFTRAPVKRLEL